MSVQTPNMNLIQPTIGIDSGLFWEQSSNNNSYILDGHNHSPGYGVQINPSGININADLTFNNTNNLIQVRSVRFQPLNANISNPADIGCLYESVNNLWFNDGLGNQVQITSGGSVNATSSGISSGSATAGFLSSVLVVSSAPNTPANIQAQSILLGNNIANSKYVTLSAPSSLAANYNLILPSIPGSSSFLQIDTAGNITAGPTIAAGIGTSNIAPNAVTNSELALGLQMFTSALTISAGAVTMNVATANSFYVLCTASAALTVNLSNFIDGQAAIISINAAGYTVPVTFTPATGAVKWQGAMQPAQTTGIDIYTILYNAITGNYYAAVVQDY